MILILLQLNKNLEEKTKNFEDLILKTEALNKENEKILEQKNDLLNRLTEKMNLIDDLNEKIKRLDNRLSFFEKKDKDFNLNSYNEGRVFLDLMNESQNQGDEEISRENEHQDNYTINMKINLKKNKLGITNYGQKSSVILDKRKKTLMEITDQMHQKPLSKV